MQLSNFQVHNSKVNRRKNISKTSRQNRKKPERVYPVEFAEWNGATILQKNKTYFTFQNLLIAYYQCRQRKRKTANAGKFELTFEQKLLQLEKELQNKTYIPGKSICFIVTQPKVREIFAADFRDRVVHHLLVNYLEPIWERKFIFHSFACRKNKGALLAINYLKKFIRSATKNYSCSAYYLQIDIATFFMSLRKDVLFDKISKQTKNLEILWLAKIIIFHDPTKNFYRKGNQKLIKFILCNKSLFKVSSGQGLPIGNLTSQFFANIYLNSLDQFIKHQLQAKYYLRYVDDIILIHKDPKQLTLWKKQIDYFLKKELFLKLHPHKTVQQSIYKGINFVGFIVKPNHCLIRKRTVHNFKEKLRQFNEMAYPASKEIFQERLENILSIVNSHYGQFCQANTWHLRKSIYIKNFGILKIYIQSIDTNFSYFQIKSFSKKTLRSPHN